MSMLRFMTVGDALLAVGLLLISALLFVGMGDRFSGAGHVVVEVSGTRVMELSLDSDVTRTVKGSRGDTVIEISGGKVRITYSDCPNHYCIDMGPISHVGEAIVCVPNRVFVTIRGGSDEEAFDGVTQ